MVIAPLEILFIFAVFVSVLGLLMKICTLEDTRSSGYFFVLLFIILITVAALDLKYDYFDWPTHIWKNT